MNSLKISSALALGCTLALLAGCNSPWRLKAPSISSANPKANEAQARMLDTYVRSIGRTPYDRVSFWPRDNPICIRIMGQPPEWADYIKARIRYDGLIADAPMDNLKCHAVTLQIAFTDHFDDFVQELATRKPDAFGYRTPGAMWSDLATVKGPIHAWYKKFDDDDSLITSVLIVIDRTQVHGIKTAALADYLAFVSLAQVDTGKYMPAAPTILNLMSGNAVGGAPPEELSELDRLYVKSIYSSGSGADDFTTTARVKQRMRSLLLQRQIKPEMFAASPDAKVATSSTQ